MPSLAASALLLLASPAALPSVPGDEEWLALDRELARLPSAPAQGSSWLEVTGFLKTSYAHADLTDETLGDLRLSGFSLDNARVLLRGGLEDFEIRVALEGSSDFGLGYAGEFGAGSTVRVLDAQASWWVSEEVRTTLGSFRTPVVGSALLEEDQLLFIDRTYNGYYWQARDPGAMVDGEHGRVHWWAAAQNGSDGVGDELALTGRVLVRVFGAGPPAVQEGARGAPEELTGSLGAAYYRDTESADAQATALEGYGTWGRLSGVIEGVDYDGDLLDAVFWTVTVSYLLVPDEWEIAARYEDYFDRAQTDVWRLGAVRYIQGLDAKWQVNYSALDNDGGENTADVVAVALVVSI